MNAEFISIFSGHSNLSLVVVDEAHCVSEWCVLVDIFSPLIFMIYFSYICLDLPNFTASKLILLHISCYYDLSCT